MAKQTRVVGRLLRRPLEWFGIRLAQLVIPRLSSRALSVLVRLGVALAPLCDRRGRKIARANLRLMFGARLTPARERILVHRCYHNLIRTVLNLFWLLRDTRARVLSHVEFAPGVLERLRRHQPTVMLGAHLGNWEFIAQASVLSGLPVLCVAKQIGSPAMTALLTRQRAQLGLEVVPVEGAARPLIRALKEGKHVGVLIDQHTALDEGGAWCDFFGLPVCVSLTPAALSRKLGAPVLFVWARPLRDGRTRVEGSDLFLPDPAVTDAARTQQFTDAIARIIRRHPSLWCLSYRRWRYVRPGDDRARYPFYARELRVPTEAPAGAI
jgi:KDO2-lipid IV(A) lauroyltransferase